MGEVKHAVLRWRDGLVFTGGEPAGPQVTIDADNREAPGPMLQLLLAAAACSATDVLLILRKMRTDVRRLEVALDGTRRDEEPRRYVRLDLAWTVAGEGLDEAKVRRAIELSLEKYCSVMATLAPDLVVHYDVRLAGA